MSNLKNSGLTNVGIPCLSITASLPEVRLRQAGKAGVSPKEGLNSTSFLKKSSFPIAFKNVL